MNPAALEAAFTERLDVAASLGDVEASPQAADEWDADEVLAHVCLVTAATVAAAAVAAGVDTTFENRAASDAWTSTTVPVVQGGTRP